MPVRLPLRRTRAPRRRLPPSRPQTFNRTANEIELEFPIELATENRLRAMHPIARGKLIKKQRQDVAWYWKTVGKVWVPRPVVITLTRIGRRTDEHDSLRACMKHIADEVALLLGFTNDDTPDIQWLYHQEPRGQRPPSIRIRVETRQEVA